MKSARLSRGSAPERAQVPLAVTVLVATVIVMTTYVAPLAGSSPYSPRRETAHIATAENGSVMKLEEPQRIGLAEAGEALQISPSGTHVEKVSPSEIERRLAWIDGTLVLDGTLEQAVEEFNRYNSRRLVIDDPLLRILPVVGRYDAHNPDLFAEDLNRRYRIEHLSLGSPGSKEGTILLKRHPISDATGESIATSTRHKEIP